VSDSYFL
jgi:hypothetical protein